MAQLKPSLPRDYAMGRSLPERPENKLRIFGYVAMGLFMCLSHYAFRARIAPDLAHRFQPDNHGSADFPRLRNVTLKIPA